MGEINKELSEYEVNRIIAEFMGHDFLDSVCKLCGQHDICPGFTKSLDALVPVWKKIGNDDVGRRDSVWLTCYASNIIKNCKCDLVERGCSIYEAAAVATARDILSMEAGDENRD
jgi:hypothetical protein